MVFYHSNRKLTNTENGASVGQVSPEPNMGTMSCDAGPLLPSRHPWSRQHGGKGEVREGGFWFSVLHPGSYI